MEHFIRTYDDVLSEAFCAEVINRFDADPLRFKGLCSGVDDNPELNPSHKVTTELIISGAPIWKDVEDVFQREFVHHMNLYAEDFSDISSIAGNLTSEPFRIKKYEIGGFFNWHIDCAGVDFHRVVAIQFYLNDVSDGGETEFDYQALSIKAARGRVIMFPTVWTYRHRGAEVVSNPKNVCTNYIRCG